MVIRSKLYCELTRLPRKTVPNIISDGCTLRVRQNGCMRSVVDALLMGRVCCCAVALTISEVLQILIPA